MKNKLFYFLTFFSIIFLLYLFFIKNIISVSYFYGLEKINYLKNKNKNNELYWMCHKYRILEEKYNRLSFLYKELLFFKKYMKNSMTFNRKVLITDILGYIINKKGKFFFINRGKLDGVEKSMIVVSGSTILGKVSEVFNHYAKVNSIDNSDQYISVVFESSSLQTILKGNREEKENTMISLSLVKDDAYTKNIVSIGEKVFTTGKGLSFPAGFFVGEVVENTIINHYENKIVIKNNFDISTLDSCEIILDYIPLEGISFH